MPIPKPHENEEKDKYIIRCSEFLINGGEPQKQISDICCSIWRENIRERKYKDLNINFNPKDILEWRDK